MLLPSCFTIAVPQSLRLKNTHTTWYYHHHASLLQCPNPYQWKTPHSMMLPSPSFTVAVSCHWKTPPQHAACTNMLHHCTVGRYYTNENQFLVSSRLEIEASKSRFLQFESPLGASLQIPSRQSCVLHWGEASQISGGLQWWLTFCNFLSFPHLLSARVTRALGRVLVVLNFLHLRIMEATVLLESFFPPNVWDDTTLSLSCSQFIMACFSKGSVHLCQCDIGVLLSHYGVMSVAF